LTHPVTLGWTKQDGVASYTLLRAPVTNYPSTTGDFVPVTIPAGQPDASGRYTITDTPAIRKSYKYRLVAHDAAGSTVVAEKDLNSDPFIDSVSSSLTVNSTNIGTAYAAQVEIGNPSAYLTDLYVDIYRAEVPANASPTPGSYQNVAVNSSAPAFTRIENGLSLKGNNLTYLDTGLTIGTNYIYRHVIKYGATASAAVELPNTAATASGDPVVDFTGYVQTASVPSASGGAVITQVSASSSGTNTMYYFTITGGTLTNLREATVQVQTRATTAAALTSWSAYSSITPGSIAYTTTSIAAGTVPANTYYFTITRPTAALPVTNDYRLVLVDQDGNVASYDAASATVLVNDTALGW
jgi:hypothetical protein